MATGGTKAQAPARILVVDDEPAIVELISATLEMSGFTVTTAATGAEAVRAASASFPHLVVLDVMLPDGEGFDVARRLREIDPGVSVLFLSARGTPVDRVTGLTVGGDDYVAKPFSLEELVARVRTILRRTHPELYGPAPGRLRYADLELDEDAYEVRRAGRRVELSPTEFALLRYLMVNAGRVVTRAQIVDYVWDYDYDGNGRVVESYISFLRRKLGGEPPLIHTVRGVGYSLRLLQGTGRS